MITGMPRIAIAMADFEAAVDTFRDTCGMPVLDFSGETVPDLGAHVGMCMPDGGSMVELMAPANPDLPLSQAIDRFLQRRGDGFYALMLEAPDPNAEAEELLLRGLEVLPLMPGAGGRDIHPRSTHGVLIRIYPTGSVKNPGGHDYGPLGLSGIVRAIIATTDVHAAVKVYGEGLGLEVGPVETDSERGVLSALVTPPTGGVIELVSVADESKPFARKIEGSISTSGEGLYAIVLQADDPAAVLSALAEGGAAVDGAEAMVFGARVVIER